MRGALDLFVATTITVSEVEVSPSTVTLLKVSFGYFRHQRLESLLLHGCVREYERKHRGHVRRDHSRSLREPGYAYRRPADVDRSSRTLRKGVGRHDCARGAFYSVRPQTVAQGFYDDGNSLARQRHADNAGGSGEHMPFRYPEGLGDQACQFLYSSDPDRTREGIRIS